MAFYSVVARIRIHQRYERFGVLDMNISVGRRKSLRKRPSTTDVVKENGYFVIYILFAHPSVTGL